MAPIRDRGALHRRQVFAVAIACALGSIQATSLAAARAGSSAKPPGALHAATRHALWKTSDPGAARWQRMRRSTLSRTRRLSAAALEKRQAPTAKRMARPEFNHAARGPGWRETPRRRSFRPDSLDIGCDCRPFRASGAPSWYAAPGIGRTRAGTQSIGGPDDVAAPASERQTVPYRRREFGIWCPRRSNRELWNIRMTWKGQKMTMQGWGVKTIAGLGMFAGWFLACAGELRLPHHRHGQSGRQLDVHKAQPRLPERVRYPADAGGGGLPHRG
jgi:hypothetical protein